MVTQARASAAAPPRARAHDAAQPHRARPSTSEAADALFSKDTGTLVRRALQALDVVSSTPTARRSPAEQEAHRELAEYARDETVRALDALLEDDAFWTVEQRRGGAAQSLACQLFTQSLTDVLVTTGYKPPPPAEQLVAAARHAVADVEELDEERYAAVDWPGLAVLARSRVRRLSRALHGMELLPSRTRWSLLLKGKRVLAGVLAAAIAVPGLAAQDIAKDYVKNVYNVYAVDSLQPPEEAGRGRADVDQDGGAREDGDEREDGGTREDGDLRRALLEAPLRKAEAEARLAELQLQAAARPG